LIKSHYSCAELADMRLPGYPATRQGWEKTIERAGWAFNEIKSRGRGGIRREYQPSAAVIAQIKIIQAVTHPAPLQQAIKAVRVEVQKMIDEQEATDLSRRRRAETVLQSIAGGSDRDSLTLHAHCEIIDDWKVWFSLQQPLKKSNSWEPYANSYNLLERPITKAVREAYPTISSRSIKRWEGALNRGDYEALKDRRNGSKLKGRNAFSVQPLLYQAATKLMMDRPGIRTGQLYELLGTASIEPTTQEVLFNAPSYAQVYRFQQAWIAANSELYLKATNPDAWKNKCMLAFGSADEDVHELNQRWEMDATPADWLLLDEDGKKRRYTVSVIIDVWSRRIMIVVARTPKSQTHCFALRRALIAWGVPRQIVTDNGADYQSNHFRRVLSMLGIEHKSTNPFSPEEKPFIERVIGTLNHSILELLPNFAGHNVAERKAIEARTSFADRLTKQKGGEVDFCTAADITGEQMQQQLNLWNAGIYEQRTHGTLGISPFAKAVSWTGETRRIEDVRSLDILLSPPASGGTRKLQKKGILLDGAWFIAAEFGDVDVGSELHIYETEDLGRVIVYHRKNFLCIAECPHRTGVDRKAIAALADANKQRRLSDARAVFKRSTRDTIDTNELLEQHLQNKARAAGKLLAAPFGAARHQSHGLDQAVKAIAALAGPTPSDEAAVLRAEAQAAMAAQAAEQAAPRAERTVVMHPSAAQNVSIVAGMSASEKYEYWLQLDAKYKTTGDLEDAEERRWHKVFPNSTTYRSQKSMRGELAKTGN
jgi:putative transposase